MNCDEAKLKTQALIDNELEESEISEVVDHIESCYICREEYKSMLKLKKQLSGFTPLPPQDEWLENLYKNRKRRFSGRLGFFMILAFNLLIAAYLLFMFFTDNTEGIFIKILVAGSIISVIVLFLTALTDRISERKTDKYREIIK